MGGALPSPTQPIRGADLAKPRHQRDVSQLAAFIKANAPAAPACFESRDSWVLWLHEGEASGQVKVLKRDEQRRKVLEFRDDINFCRDCDVLHRNRMRLANKCHPPERVQGTRQRAEEQVDEPRAPIPVVAVCLTTSAIKHYQDIGDVIRHAFDPAQVRSALVSGHAYMGHAWAHPQQAAKKQIAKSKSDQVMAGMLGLLVVTKEPV